VAHVALRPKVKPLNVTNSGGFAHRSAAGRSPVFYNLSDWASRSDGATLICLNPSQILLPKDQRTQEPLTSTRPPSTRFRRTSLVSNVRTFRCASRRSASPTPTNVDLSLIARNTRLNGERNIQFRFEALNGVLITRCFPAAPTATSKTGPNLGDLRPDHLARTRRAIRAVSRSRSSTSSRPEPAGCNPGAASAAPFFLHRGQSIVLVVCQPITPNWLQWSVGGINLLHCQALELVDSHRAKPWYVSGIALLAFACLALRFPDLRAADIRPGAPRQAQVKGKHRRPNGNPTTLHGMSLYAGAAQGKQFSIPAPSTTWPRTWKCTVYSNRRPATDYKTIPR